MKRLILLAGLCVFFSCSKPGGEPADPQDPGNPVKQVTITSVSPDSGESTGSITITGTGFNTRASGNEVRLGTLMATVKTASATQLVIELPLGIEPGFHVITVTANNKIAVKTNGYYVKGWLINTIAGTGDFGSINGPGSSATFINPQGIIADRVGNFYLADGHRIRKINAQGEVSTYAGRGIKGSDNGSATVASFNFPTAIAIDNNGNLYVADQSNHLIRKISTTGNVTTIAGSGAAGHTNGTGTAASFDMPYGIVVDPAGTTLYVGDYNNSIIRKIELSTLNVTDFAGNGSSTSEDGVGAAAGIPKPGGLYLDNNGNLYVTERGGGKIRKITPSASVSTIGGNLSTTSMPSHLVTDEQQNIYVVFKAMNLIKRITPTGFESTIFGDPISGDATGPARQAAFLFPEGIALVKSANGSLSFYICDAGNRKIKRILKE